MAIDHESELRYAMEWIEGLFNDEDFKLDNIHVTSIRLGNVVNSFGKINTAEDYAIQITHTHDALEDSWRTSIVDKDDFPKPKIFGK